MINTETLGTLEKFRTEIMDNFSNQNVISFKLNELNYTSDGVVANDNILRMSAIKKICRSIRVFPAFLNYSEQMTDADWDMIKQKLNEVNTNLTFWGKSLLGSDNQNIINKIYTREDYSELTDDFNLTIGRYFEMIKLALEGTTNEFNIEKTIFDKNKEEVGLVFVDPNSIFPVLPGDNWTKGASITFDQIKFSGFPYYGRLICRNGMVDGVRGLSTSISSKKFNFDRIQTHINKLLVKGRDQEDQVIIESVNHLQKNNLSLNEFFKFKEFFDKRNEEGQYNHIISNIFNEHDVYKAYGENIKEKSQKWLSSANSGRNAYDFFNDMTSISTHTNKTHLEPEDAHELSLMATKQLLFKEKLDLEDIAPQVNFTVAKKIAEDAFISKN